MFNPYHIETTPGPATYEPRRLQPSSKSPSIRQRFRLPESDHLGDPGKYLLPSTLYNQKSTFGCRTSLQQRSTTPAPSHYDVPQYAVRRAAQGKTLGSRCGVDYWLKEQRTLPGVTYSVKRGYQGNDARTIGQKCKYYGLLLI